VSRPADDEGSFAAGRQALLDALQNLEQRTNERAERTLRDAEQRAQQIIADAEQRARQIAVEAAQRVSELEESLTEVRDNLESARSQLEEQFVAIRGLVDVARANLTAVRERSMGHRPQEPVRSSGRIALPPLTVAQPAAEEPIAPAGLDDLRAAVDALKRPKRATRDDSEAPEAERSSPIATSDRPAQS
jgi:hypothetical protein